MENKLLMGFYSESSYLRNILLNIPGCIYWKDLLGNYMGCNRIFLGMVGLSNESEVLGKTDKDFCWKNQANDLREHDQLVIESRQTQILEEEVELSNGNKKLYSVIKHPLYNEKGNIVGILGTSIDISYRKEIEDSLRKAKFQAEAANRSKSNFIANISHDIHTPITGILAIGQHMLNAVDESKTTLNHLNIHTTLNQLMSTVKQDSHLLINATNELLTLCNDILKVVQLESGRMLDQTEVFNLRKLLQHNIDLLIPVANDKQLELSFTLDSKIPSHLKGSRLYLERILLSLATNALKFTKQGFVEISVVLDEEQSISAPFKLGDAVQINFHVKDSGIGVAQDKKELLFEHFSRLNPSYEGIYKGTGLGLYTVKHYVEAMKGYINVESQLGKGSCFTITLSFTVADGRDAEASSTEINVSGNKMLDPPKRCKPSQISPEKGHLCDEKSLPDLVPQTDPSLNNGVATILIVEDSPLVVIGMQLTLKPFHCIVEVAKNGTQAVEMAKTKQYDLIFMDVGLPDFSGIEATKKIRNFIDVKHSQVPIVAVTGHAGNPDQRQACFDAGMQAILNKPAKSLELESALKRYVFGTQDEKS